MDRYSPLRPRFGGVVFNGGPPRADDLHCEEAASGGRSGIRFAVDDRFTGEILVDWSGVGGVPTPIEVGALNLSLTAMMAQHALPARLRLSVPVSARGLDTYHDILKMLYDIRTFCDETDVRAVPVLGQGRAAYLPSNGGALNPGRALVLISGGFDSTLAMILLKEAGYRVEALHVRTNRHVEDAEEHAAGTIAGLCGVPIHRMCLSAPDQEAIGRYYSRTYGIYPFYNSVPHGRDFPLAVIGAIMARRLDCGVVVFGHEKESRRKVIETSEGSVYRHDVESVYGNNLVRSFLRQTVAPELDMFSPLAGLSIYLVRAIMLQRFKDISRHLQFCFWGRRCGKCLKCLSTYTMQRHLGGDAIPFEENPFADRDDRDMELLANPDRPSHMLGYGPQMHYAMRQLVQDGVYSDEDYWLEVFRSRGLGRVVREWDQIRSICLDVERPGEVPAKVAAVVDGLVGESVQDAG